MALGHAIGKWCGRIQLSPVDLQSPCAWPLPQNPDLVPEIPATGSGPAIPVNPMGLPEAKARQHSYL